MVYGRILPSRDYEERDPYNRRWPQMIASRLTSITAGVSAGSIMGTMKRILLVYYELPFTRNLQEFLETSVINIQKLPFVGIFIKTGF